VGLHPAPPPGPTVAVGAGGWQVAGEKLIAQQYECASIIFSDIVGFTTFSSHVQPSDVVPRPPPPQAIIAPAPASYQ
jgi:hypothetical protein